MLALRTGWTPDIIGGDADNGITDDFRRDCHMALYGEALSPLLDDIAAALAAPTSGLTPAEFARISKVRSQAERERVTLLELLDISDG
jgi:hypothetical protein